MMNSDSAELPELRNTARSHRMNQSQAMGKSINITMVTARSSNDGGPTASPRDQPRSSRSDRNIQQLLNKRSTRGDIKRNDVECEQDVAFSDHMSADGASNDGKDAAAGLTTPGIKIEVRNSNIFGPGNARTITDKEIRNIRRNVVTMKSQSKQSSSQGFNSPKPPPMTQRQSNGAQK